MIPTIIIIALIFMELGISLAMHGKPRKNYNFKMYLISAIIMFTLYYYAGLFDKFFN